VQDLVKRMARRDGPRSLGTAGSAMHGSEKLSTLSEPLIPYENNSCHRQ
jgi:hypothetical protein